jgi:phosphohistidine phosphatase SixA
MSRIRTSLSALCAAVSFCALTSSAHAETYDALRGPGLTLFLRHAAAEWSGEGPEIGAIEPAKLDAKACAAKRRLTEEGRLQAQSVASALQSLELGPLDVQTVGLCRTFETARVIGANPRIVDGLTPMPGRAPSLRAQGEMIEKIVRAGEQARGLRVIVGDYEAMQALYGVTLAEGEGLVLKVQAGEVAAVARIRTSDWTALQPVASGERATTATRKF